MRNARLLSILIFLSAFQSTLTHAEDKNAPAQKPAPPASNGAGNGAAGGTGGYADYGAGGSGYFVPCAFVDNHGVQVAKMKNSSCVVKKEIRTGNQDTVVYEAEQPTWSESGLSKEKVTRTVTAVRNGGRVVSSTQFEGENENKAPVAYTQEFNPLSQGYGTYLMQSYATVKNPNSKSAKAEKYVFYHQGLCNQIRAVSSKYGKSENAVLGLCSKIMAEYEEAANATKVELAKEGKKLGLMEPTMNSKTPGFREAGVGRVTDLMTLVSSCANPYGAPTPNTGAARMNPAPKEPPPSSRGMQRFGPGDGDIMREIKQPASSEENI